MLKNFHRVSKNLYRGAAPTLQDLKLLKDKYKIKRIISLDADVGKRINRSCKLLGLDHIIFPIDFMDIKSALKLFEADFFKLIDPNVKTYIHCFRGKDRTGLAVALYRCLEEGWAAERAIFEAKRYGFGTGIDPLVKAYYQYLITEFAKNTEKDINFEDINSTSDTDIVGNSRTDIGEYYNFNENKSAPSSFAPYVGTEDMQFPFNDSNRKDDGAYPDRQNYGLDDIFNMEGAISSIPQVGQFDQEMNVLNPSGYTIGNGGGYA